MKSKKALRKLSKVENVLTGVIARYAGGKDGVLKLLDTAKVSISRAKKAVTARVSSKAAKKPPAKADSSRSRDSARRKRVAPAAKKQSAVA